MTKNATLKDLSRRTESGGKTSCAGVQKKKSKKAGVYKSAHAQMEKKSWYISTGNENSPYFMKRFPNLDGRYAIVVI